MSGLPQQQSQPDVCVHVRVCVKPLNFENNERYCLKLEEGLISG